jgi:hypothetical protein
MAETAGTPMRLAVKPSGIDPVLASTGLHHAVHDVFGFLSFRARNAVRPVPAPGSVLVGAHRLAG